MGIRSSHDEEPLETGITHLRGLDLAGLRACWHSMLGRTAPAHVPKHLLFRILAYRLQADRHGDLGKDTLRLLDRISARDAGETPPRGKTQRRSVSYVPARF